MLKKYIYIKCSSKCREKIRKTLQTMLSMFRARCHFCPIYQECFFATKKTIRVTYKTIKCLFTLDLRKIF